jgi:fluoride exporter
MINAILVISLGASIGAVARWGLGLWLNGVMPALPLGTLSANVIGGYLIGIAVAIFANHPAIPQAWRLLTITGFLGGLTTFSTFSAEVVTLLQQGRIGWAMTGIASHLIGSLLATLGGIATVGLFDRT